MGMGPGSALSLWIHDKNLPTDTEVFVNTSLCFRSRNCGRAKKGNSTLCVESYLSFEDLLCALLSCRIYLTPLALRSSGELLGLLYAWVLLLNLLIWGHFMRIWEFSAVFISFYCVQGRSEKSLIGKIEIGHRESIVFQIYLALLGDYIQFTTEFLVVTTVLMLQASWLLAQNHKWWASCTTPL